MCSCLCVERERGRDGGKEIERKKHIGPREGAGETGEGTNDASQQAKTVLGYRSAGAVYSSSFAPLSPRPVAGLGRGQGRQANGDREREHGTECQL